LRTRTSASPAERSITTACIRRPITTNIRSRFTSRPITTRAPRATRCCTWCTAVETSTAVG
jgi:hypothetical protein